MEKEKKKCVAGGGGGGHVCKRETGSKLEGASTSATIIIQYPPEIMTCEIISGRLLCYFVVFRGAGAG